MSAKRHERTFARRSAVQVLYTSEIRNQPPSVLLETGRCLNEDGPLSDYALKLLDGIESHRDVIDDYIESASENWQVSRMPIVDRTILRLAVFEMVYAVDVPVSVAINEAVELAKDFGGEDESPRFVNGVLGRIAKQLEGGESSSKKKGKKGKNAAADDAVTAPAEGEVGEVAAAAGEGEVAAVEEAGAEPTAEHVEAADPAVEPEA